MLVVYMSLVGNVRNFVKRLDMDSLELNQMNPLIEVDKDYVIIVPTYSDMITDIFCDFIDYKDNRKYLKCVVGSGDKNFNNGYIFSARHISKKYKVPLAFDFEKSGTDEDIENFKKEVRKY